MIQGVWRRVLLAAALATAGIAALAAVLSRGEPAGPAASSSGRADGSVLVDEFFLPDAVPRGEAWMLYIAARGAELPQRVAPVVAIGEGGTVRVVRGAPTPDGPEAEPWWAAGIVLPGQGLRQLDPRARAALLGLMRSWRGSLSRRARGRALTWGIEDPDELELLSRWER